MSPRDILDVASDLVAGPREADWRSGVSRAYYAAFHVARLLLEGCGFAVPRAEQAHAYLWLRLSNTGRPDVDAAGAKLDNLRSKRNWADYDLNRPFAEALAVAWVQNAEDVIDLFEQVPTLPHVQQQIVDGIRGYERDVLRQVTWQAPPS